MRNKRCLITGANSGLGKACALQLAQMDCEVIMLCRSRERGELACNQIRQQSGNTKVVLMLADLASQASIRSTQSWVAFRPQCPIRTGLSLQENGWFSEWIRHIPENNDHSSPGLYG